jgi:hypothetical protein
MLKFEDKLSKQVFRKFSEKVRFGCTEPKRAESAQAETRETREIRSGMLFNFIFTDICRYLLQATLPASFLTMQGIFKLVSRRTWLSGVTDNDIDDNHPVTHAKVPPCPHYFRSHFASLGGSVRIFGLYPPSKFAHCTVSVVHM